MMKCFLDTTIITDLTLKKKDIRDRTQIALNAFEHSEYPQYALKEFNAGPISHYIWWRNILMETNSLQLAYDRLGAEASTPRKNRTRTVLAAMAMAEGSSTRRQTPRERAESHRVALTRAIASARRRLDKMATMTHPLECHNLAQPRLLETNMMAIKPILCEKTDCSLAEDFHSHHQVSLALLAKTIELQPPKPENVKRLAAITAVRNRPDLDNDQCRNLGDAVFALLSPRESIILTTNIRDHRPLAEALGKKASHPSELNVSDQSDF
jgi:hypothetical protein